MTNENMKQINELKKMITAHTAEQVITDASVSRQIESLMPLVSLIEPLQEIVQNQKTNEAMNQRFAGWARFFIAVGGVIAAIYAIISLIFRLEK